MGRSGPRPVIMNILMTRAIALHVISTDVVTRLPEEITQRQSW